MLEGEDSNEGWYPATVTSRSKTGLKLSYYSESKVWWDAVKCKNKMNLQKQSKLCKLITPVKQRNKDKSLWSIQGKRRGFPKTNTYILDKKKRIVTFSGRKINIINTLTELADQTKCNIYLRLVPESGRVHELVRGNITLQSITPKKRASDHTTTSCQSASSQTSPSHIPAAEESPTMSSPVMVNTRSPPWPIPQSTPCSNGSPLHTPLKPIRNFSGKKTAPDPSPDTQTFRNNQYLSRVEPESGRVYELVKGEHCTAVH